MNSTLLSVQRHHRNQEGIALVIVLGLLAVLVVLGVAFSISMRTERMATRSYVDVVKSRHLVHTAFNRVLDKHIPDELAGRVYPEIDAFGSGVSGTNNIKLLGDRSTISGVIFVPASLRSAAFQEEGSTGFAWLPLEDPIDGTFYGEYAYLVVNSSGLLDANQIGANEDLAIPRKNGVSPDEIRFHPDMLPEVMPGNEKYLDNYRTEFRKFESVSELHFLLSTADFEGSLGGRPLRQNVDAYGPWADNLHVFSRFPKGFSDDNLTSYDSAYVGGDPAGWNLPEIKTAMKDGFDLEQPSLIPNLDHFIHALYDYADEGYVPYPMTGPETDQFQRFSSKPVPMVNEVIVSNSLQLVVSGSQTQLIHRTYVTVETWFPFPADPDNAQFAVEIVNPITIPQVAPPYPAFIVAPTLESGPTPAQFNPSTGSGYNLTTFVYVQRQNVNGLGQPPYNAGGPFSARVVIPGNIRVTYNGLPVDIVFGPWENNDFQLSAPRPALTVGGAPVTLAIRSRAVNDPRINWFPSQWVAGNSTPTPGIRNSVINAPNADEIDFMFARRGPLESVGEIGYLLYDANKPWQTIRLIGEDPAIGAKLMDRITVYTNELRRGLVNVNTRQTNALASTIWTLPIEKYPNAADASVLSDPQAAIDLSDYLIQRINSDGAVTNLSDLAERFQSANVDSFLGTDNDKFSRESLIRNSVGLWGTRHQLYTVFVAARTFSDAYDPKNAVMLASRDNFVTAEQRAVAVLWRDPFLITNNKGTTTHQTFVQFFHWFTGAFD